MLAPPRQPIQSFFARHAAAALGAVCLLAPVVAHSAPEPDSSPERREVWTPTDQLKEVLAKYPNAVVLSREQYESLIREAGQVRKAAPKAPRRAVLTSADYQAHVAGKVAQVTGTFTVNVLSDEWAQLPLNFGGVALGSVTVDGQAALSSETESSSAYGKPKRGSNVPTVPVQPGSLFLHGKGERAVVIEFSIPIATKTGVSSFAIKLPQAAAGAFALELPSDQRVESSQSLAVKKTPAATTITATLSPVNPTLALSWRGTGDGSQSLAAQVTASGTYTINAENVHSEYDIDIQTPLGNLASAYSMALPANAKVLQVAGDEIANWEIKDGKLRVALQAGERADAKLRLAMETPSLGAAANARLTLPVPRFEGVSRMHGAFSIVGDDGVIIKEIATDASPESTRPAASAAPHWIASYRFVTPPNPPQVTVERVRPRFSADLDTRVEFKQEAIFIERMLTLHPEKGEVFEVALTLPAGEELMSVRNANDSEPDWHIQDRKLGLKWTTNDDGGAARQFKIRTRAEPSNWNQIGADGILFAPGDMKIDGAERVTGYIALKADDAFRLEAEPSETLERRDGRTTPVEGDYAWFRGADFTLRVKIAKRPGEVLAALTGYALPLEGVLDLHAQIDYHFLHSGTRLVRIRVPKAIAANFHFDGPQIAERNLADDIWTIVFQKELTGDYAMKITGQVAVEKTGSVPKPGDGADAGSEKESRFEIAVPVIAPLDVVRTSGVWVIEANTETEITFAAKGMNELDSLLAPRLSDYQPRHRVIGVFTCLGADYNLTLSGVRHAAATVLTSVVDRLDLDTVVSASGTERNQATFQLRTAGAQYLDVQLPEKSRLLSLSVNSEAVKPVGDRSDEVRVELPGTTNGNEALKVSVLYETPKSAWHGSGGYSVRAPRLARTIPILRSQWRLFLPDGFEYTGIDSNLRIPALNPEPPLMVGILNGSLLPKSLWTAPIPFDSRVASEPRRVEVEATPMLRVEPMATPGLAVAQQLQHEFKTKTEAERAHRGDYEKRGNEAIANGDQAMIGKDYERALEFYRNACDIIPNTAVTRALYDRALRDFCGAGCKLAEQRITEGRYSEAQSILKLVTDDRYNPHYKQAIIILARLEQPDYYNKTVGPQFRANIEQVKQYLTEAQGFYDSGRFDLANKRCDQILAIDKYNIAARKMQEKIDRAKTDHGVVAYGETRAKEMAKLDVEWSKSVRRSQLSSEATAEQDRVLANRTERMMEKLQKIIVPKLELREVTIREAIDYLKKKSVELDVDSPAGEKGVNIVLKLDSGGAAAPPAPQPGVLPIPGLEPIPAVPGAPPIPETPAAPPINPLDARITVSLTDIPLIEALRYVTGLSTTKFKVEPYAVFIVPASVNTDVLVTKEYKIRPDLIPRAPGTADVNPLSAGPQRAGGRGAVADQTKGTPGIADKETAKNWLISNGVQFNGPGASAVYLAGSGRLIVRNTQEQLDLLDTIVQSNQAGPVPNPTHASDFDTGVATSPVLITKEWRVRENLLPQTDSTGVAREAAEEWLTSKGVRFNAGASAVFFAPVGRQKMSLGSNGATTSSVFLPASGKLVVRNTSEQLDLIDTILAASNLSSPDDQASKLKDSQGIAGLLPMKLDLPKIGRMIVLDGLSAADRVEFRYEDWWTRARHLWLWFVAGGFVCLFAAQNRPWWRTCWVALALTFYPMVTTTAATPICNSLLAGWLVSVIIQRTAVRLVFAPKRKEATA